MLCALLGLLGSQVILCPSFLSQLENFKLVQRRYVFLMKRFELFVDGWRAELKLP